MLSDHQRDYLPDGGLPLAGTKAAVMEIGQLLDLAHRHGMPLFHVVPPHARPGAPLFDPRQPDRVIGSLKAKTHISRLGLTWLNLLRFHSS